MKKFTNVFDTIEDYVKFMNKADYKTIIAVFEFKGSIVVTYLDNPPII